MDGEFLDDPAYRSADYAGSDRDGPRRRLRDHGGAKRSVVAEAMDGFTVPVDALAHDFLLRLATVAMVPTDRLATVRMVAARDQGSVCGGRMPANAGDGR